MKGNTKSCYISSLSRGDMVPHVVETTAKSINENVMSCCQDKMVIMKIGARLIRFLNG